MDSSAKPTSKSELLEPAIRMKQLVEMSHTITVDKNISISKYFNSGRELIKSASALEEKGDLERAFVLYLRYMTLFIEKLVHHPEYSKADRVEKNLVKTECANILVHAEELKKKLLEKFAKEYGEINNELSNTDRIQKRSINQVESSKYNCDIDDIDKKFDFSCVPDTTQKDTVFDPFNIEDLKRSFDSSNRN